MPAFIWARAPGAVALLPLIDLGLAVYGDSRTFSTAGIEAYEHLS